MMGNMLRDREQQYIATKDEVTQTWRILDTWHDELRSLGPEDEIADDSEAVKILTEGEFIALVREASRLGVLQNATYGTGEAEFEATILEKEQEIQKLQEQMVEIKEEKSEVIRNTSHSEEYELKEKAMNSIIQLIGLQEITNLGKE